MNVFTFSGCFLPVPVSSDDFVSILTLLQSAYLFEESKHSFKYTTAFWVKNAALEKKYNACRDKRREQGYTDEDLKETYGFLLFDELSKAKSVGEAGVLTGNGACTTLGDPSKGVYLSMYSDCLDLNRWYHGKSGYIVILRLTPGKVKKISENYTQNLTDPTVGFDCHVSEQLPSVSSKTSSFLAFERTQYFLYEMLDNGSTALSPSLACPYGVVAFSYTDTKETQQEKCKKKKFACPYSPWMGMLQIGSQTVSVEIRSTAGALAQAKVPSVIKAERAISMFNLRKLLPKTVFDTTHTGKGLQEDLECSVFEIFALSFEEKEKLSPLLQGIKEKDVALIHILSNGSYLVLIHESHFIFQNNDNGMTTNKVLQGVFVFPGSQAIQRVAKNDKMKRSLPSDALRVLPLLTYAEGEIEKTNLNTNEDLCEIFVHYMQSYATLISPGLPSSPFREVSIFPDQYDVPDSHGHLYSSPEWTDKHWQSLKLYLNNPRSFQLPVCKASEIFVAGQEVRREDLEDDIYICLSSPEEPSTSFISSESEVRQDQDCSADVETPKNKVQPVMSTSQEAISVISISTETAELPLRTDEPSEELIVSITSATQTVGEKDLEVMEHDQLSVTAVLQTATLNSLSEIVQGKMTVNCSDDIKLLTEKNTMPVEQNIESAQSPSLQIVKTLLEKDQPFCMDHVTTQDLENPLGTPENQGNNLENDNSSPEPMQVLEEAVDTYLTDNALLKELETYTLEKKSERWGLKPLISTCGRIFIPFGSVDTDQIKSLQEKIRLAKDKMHPEEKCFDALCEVSSASKNTQTMDDDKKTITPNEEEHHRKCVDHVDSDKSVTTTSTDNILEEHKENYIKDVPIAEKSKSDTMLKRLKRVILKKRNTDVLRIGLNVTNDQENGPIPKRTKRDSTPESVKSSSDILAKNTHLDSQILTSLPSVDPIFAQALGLTPKGTLDINSVQRSDLPMEKDLALAKEYASCKQQHQSSPKALGPRFKMLKKNQSISAEQVKKKWWLHFQTPSCYAEKLYEGGSRDISVRKTVKEKSETSSEALNLLADLALSANKEQVSPHPIQVCLQEFGSSLKKFEITKDVSNPEQQSVLHALLRQPASKTIQPHETPSPESFEGSELVDVICQEHAYSLPSSPSLLLALPAPFQVSPLNGSSRLLDTQRQWDGEQPMHAIINPEEKAECNQNDPEDPKRSWYRRKFCQLRTVVNKETSVQVTRHWEGLYDFNLDSWFTVEDKDKAIVRALHGPWDLSIHDTTEEVQLIVHMWIGLFYSRSTARFFHLDSDITLASSEDSFDAVNASNEKGDEQKVTETVVSIPFSKEKTPEESVSQTVLSSSLPNAADEHEPEILDLSKPKNCVVDKELDLNLSQKPSNVENSKQNPVQNKLTQALDLIPQALQAAPPYQWYWNPIHTTGNLTPLKYVVPVNENCGNFSKLNHQVFIPVWGGIPNTHLVTNNVPTPVLPTDPQTENTSVHFPKSPEFLIRKRASHKRTQKHVYLSPVPRRKESRDKITQPVKENLPNVKTSGDLNSGNGDVDMRRSKHLLEIKNKYLEKLASINQQMSSPTSQPEKVKNCNILKKLLQEDTSKHRRPSECEILPSQHTRINISSCLENHLQNESVQSVVRHVFAFPKASSTSIVTETTCAENRNEPQSFNIVGLAPFVQAENEKCTSIINSASVSCVKEKEKPGGHCMTMGHLPMFSNQDSDIKKWDILVENTTDCSFSQDKSMETVEATFVKKTNVINNCSNDETENSYGSVTIPFIGMSTSIEDMFKEDTSNEMDKEKGVEDMEIASSDSSPAHIEVTTPLPAYADSTSHNQSGDCLGRSVAESEINTTFEIRDGEADDRCPTPTIDEQPYVYTIQSSLNYNGNDFKGLSQDGAEKEAERSCTPVQDETSVKASPLPVYTEARAKVGPQSDVELRTLRTLQCLDEFLSTLQNKSNPLFFNSKYTLNTSVSSTKNSSAIIYDFRDMEIPSNMSYSHSPESSQHFSALPSKDVLGGVQQPKETCPTSLLCPSGMLTEVLDKPIFSTEKPEQAVRIDNEKPTSNTIHQCPDMTERPPTMYQGQMNSVKQMSNSGFNSQFKPIKFCIKRTKQGKFVCSGSVFDAYHKNENCDFAQPVQLDVQNLQSTEGVSSTLPTQSIKSDKSTFKHVAERDTDSENKSSTVKNMQTDEDILKSITSFIDIKTNKITDNSLGTEGSLRCTVTNTKRKELSFLEKVSQRCLQDNSTQSSMDQECLIFLDRMKQLLKRKNQCPQVHCDQPDLLSSSPIIVQFSHLEEQDDVFGDIEIPVSFFDQKICVDMSDCEHLRDVEQPSSSKSLSHRELVQPAISAITAECARLYGNIMNKICSGNRNTSLLKDLHKIDSDDSKADSYNYFDFCSQMKKEMDDSFRNRLNSVVKKSCKIKNRFFLLVTSDDVFFNETREYLEAEGHISVQPSEFFLRESSSSPLLVIIRNEDIAEHIFEVPHLLQLRTSRVVQFAGIDEPDDVVNLTFQEIFIKGGFVMFDRAAVESLSSGDLRMILEIFQKLMQTGKWKWVLHYRDSRRFKENARLCPDAKEKADLVNKCKEDGMLDILPYHECDLLSREQPNYLQCLCHQQVQKISARYPVFVSDSETHGGYEKSGIVTMTVNSFLMESLCKIVSSST